MTQTSAQNKQAMTNIENKSELKSAEQKMIELATDEYVSKLRAALGENATVYVEIHGIDKIKIATIADFIHDEEGNKIPIRTHRELLGQTSIFIRPEIIRKGFYIALISE